MIDFDGGVPLGGCLVGNYVSEGWEQCLKSRLGSFVVFQLVAVGRQNITIKHDPQNK